MPDYYLFALSLLMIFTLPGPDMILLFQTGSSAGKSAGIITAVGLAIARLCHILFAALGLATLFKVTPWTFDVVKYTGAAYLLWLGFRLLKPGSMISEVDLSGAPSSRNYWSYFSNGVLTNLLNPKALLFSSVLLPQFISPAMGPVGVQFALLGVILVSTGLLFDCSYALTGRALSQFLKTNIRAQKIQQVAFGVLLIGFAVRLALMSHI